MPGRKPIFASLFVDIMTVLRDGLYKIFLEPASPGKRRAKRMKDNKTKNS